MSMTLTEVAQQLRGSNNKRVQLIYAFNGSGKPAYPGYSKN